ncbi:hypothetical protein [Streptomyces broussonetiae]|uniref:XRE family transcriptional regulator n=1 Tax=Streptomyces broussonetiae TaxID=2686304 RepID=A0ABV5EHG5_9ACTN
MIRALGRPQKLTISDDTPPARRHLAETLQSFLLPGQTFSGIAKTAYTSTATVSRTFRAQQVPHWELLESITDYLDDHYEADENAPFPTREHWYKLWAKAWAENGRTPYDLPPARNGQGALIQANQIDLMNVSITSRGRLARLILPAGIGLAATAVLVCIWFAFRAVGWESAKNVVTGIGSTAAALRAVATLHEMAVKVRSKARSRSHDEGHYSAARERPARRRKKRNRYRN